MSLTLHVAGDRWRAHLRSVAERHPGLVPVCKGNGYGLGLARLARKAQWLGVDAVAVGTYAEVGEIATRFDGSMVVLTPWRPFGPALDVTDDDALADRIVHTVSRVEDLDALLARRPDARFVLERLTSMQRHGLAARELWAAARALHEHPRARLEGVAMHLPLAQGSHLSQMQRLMTDVVGAELPEGPGARTVWVSHLTDAELETLRGEYPDFVLRPRIGTALWLGDREALTVTATVLDVHAVERGDAFGYRGRTAPKAGHLLVVSGGTAHGIGLEAPTGELDLRGRAGTLARGGLDALGFVRSPFSIDGKQRLFAEPPHMQASMLFVPAGARVPAVGERIDVRVRFTTTRVDAVEID
ncbi:alanine racemase [Nocardioides sp. TRM66260-LWL]|uniref:alanine racemase n=1 Tax=Nocardioides sp. TRM66260-LWL TaxID=2874478 RepID=UPI001CC81F03|nr:alanine racemase [Nocardioides sp. TRM66260-LWL]MBZ5735580.1 alanine racemase [Nocardioides sp. TRM66260-LWL]